MEERRSRIPVVVLALTTLRTAASSKVDTKEALLTLGSKFICFGVTSILRHVASEGSRLALLEAVVPLVSVVSSVPNVVLIGTFLSLCVSGSDGVRLLTGRSLEELLVLDVVDVRQGVACSTTTEPAGARGSGTHLCRSLPSGLTSDCVVVVQEHALGVDGFSPRGRLAGLDDHDSA